MKTKEQKQNKWINSIIIFALIFIVGLVVLTIAFKSIKNNSVLMVGKYGLSVVLTESMKPEISTNSLLLIKKTDDYQVRDIIVFQDEGRPVVHRIISFKEDLIITQGDNNNGEDTPITYDQIKGELIFEIPLLGLIIKILKSPFVITCVVGVSILLLVISFMKEKKEIEEGSEENEKE